MLSRKRNRVCAELKAASCNTAQFITPGITPKFRMTRRPMGHSAPCIRPLQRRAGLRAITRSFFAISSERDDVILYSRCNFFGGARGAIHCFDLSSWNALVTRISYHRGTSMTCGFAGLAQAQLTHLNSRPCSGAVARGAPRTGVPSRQRISLTARAAPAATHHSRSLETRSGTIKRRVNSTTTKVIPRDCPPWTGSPRVAPAQNGSHADLVHRRP